MPGGSAKRVKGDPIRMVYCEDPWGNIIEISASLYPIPERSTGVAGGRIYFVSK
jgi:hypothetical protein